MRALLAVIVVVALTTSAAFAQTLNVEMFPLEELTPGTMGVGRTVVRGIEIVEFDVEVLDLIPKGGFDGGPMILARFSGDVIDFSNGIAGGYSGSPVYIGDKLLGAVSMAIPFTDTHIGGITPIQSMVKALPNTEDIDFSNNTVLPTSDDNGTELDENGERISYVHDYDDALAYNEEMSALGIDKYAAVPVKTPLYFSGVSPLVMDQFRDEFVDKLGSQVQLMEMPSGRAADYGLLLNDSGDSGLLLNDDDGAPPLVGGDAIAVSLIQGDIENYVIGTLTYSDEDGQFLCFGHPLFQQGDAHVPLGKAYINWTYESSQRAFKDGVRLNTLGTLTKDHAAACGGSFNIEPEMIPVRLKIKDVDNNINRTLRYSVMRHEDFTPMLVSMGVSQGALEVLDRTPGGTMKLSYHIEGAGLKEPLRRTNYYSDDMNVVGSGAFELMPIAGLLETNIYRKVKITKIDVLMEITRNRVNASIDDAEIIVEDADELPGEELDVPAEGIVLEMGPDEGQPEAEALYSWEHEPIMLQSEAPADGEEMPPITPDQMPVEPLFGDIPTFMPGEEIKVKVRLQPFRTDPVWREFSVKVPDDFPSGQTMVVVHGGGDLISASELQGKGRSLFGMGPVIDIEERDLDAILEQIVEWPLNNELLITLQRPYDPASAMELGDDEEKPDDAVDAIYQMEWVIYNGFMLPVNIMSVEDMAAMAEMMAAGADVATEKTEAEDESDDDEECEY